MSKIETYKCDVCGAIQPAAWMFAFTKSIAKGEAIETTVTTPEDGDFHVCKDCAREISARYRVFEGKDNTK